MRGEPSTGGVIHSARSVGGSGGLIRSRRAAGHAAPVSWTVDRSVHTSPLQKAVRSHDGTARAMFDTEFDTASACGA